MLYVANTMIIIYCDTVRNCVFFKNFPKYGTVTDMLLQLDLPGFYPRDATERGISCRRVSVRPSVCHK